MSLRVLRYGLMVGLWSLKLAQICTGQVEPTDQPLNTRTVVEPSTDWSVPDQPWFSDPAIRRELDLDDRRYEKLEANYQKALERYQQGMSKIDPAATDIERAKIRDELRADFNRRVHQSTSTAISDPALRRRYNQLYWQHRGISAFNDEDVRSRIRLNDTQLERLRKLEQDWDSRMTTWRRDYSTNPDQVLKRYNQGRAEFNEGLRSVLEPAQLDGWNELTGTPYDFPAEVYFRDNRAARPVLR
ncbi:MULTISPECIES: hypothetical protein [unclassified Schlesneria]|uniref:hypothetical protein n=1 Tax=Schlesneria TaxID=656899 RepID=UPI0035A0AA7E